MRFFSITIIALFIGFLSFAQESKISGTITNYNGVDSLSISIFGDQNPVEVRVPLTKKGAFSYSFNNTGTNFVRLQFKQEDFILLVLSPGESASIEANFNNLSQTYTVSGASQSKAIQKNNAALLGYIKDMQNLQVQFQKGIDSLEKARDEYIISTITQNPSSLSSLALIDMVDIKKNPEVYAILDSGLMAAYPNNLVVKNFHTNYKNQTHLQVGSVVPNVILLDENGKEVNLESFRGNTLLLVFWATWCRPCLQEIPHIRDAYRKYNSKGFSVMSVSTDNDKQRWESFVRDQPVPWATTHDSEKKYSQLFQVSGIPFTILIDAEGKIIAKNVRGQALERHLNSIYN